MYIVWPRLYRPVSYGFSFLSIFCKSSAASSKVERHLAKGCRVKTTGMAFVPATIGQSQGLTCLYEYSVVVTAVSTMLVLGFSFYIFFVC